MKAPILLALLFLFSCTQTDDFTSAGLCDCSYSESSDSSSTAFFSGRGALLGTRFPSFEALKSVVQIEYDSTGPGQYRVRVRHCCNGKAVLSVLESGVSQGDFTKARYGGALGERLKLLMRCPYAVSNRKDLETAFNLSRRSPEWFGEGDPAFYDLAQSMAANINTPELAIKTVRDSTEKGYLNTFNHMTSQAFISSCFSETLADFIADAHERYRHPELITGRFTDAQVADLEEGPVDNYVDIVNNEWGQEIGKQLKQKYHIERETNWTPELLASYLNDLQGYYSWALQVGFKPFRPEDDVVLRFSGKINAVMKGRLTKDNK